jgi:hypothetical protein
MSIKFGKIFMNALIVGLLLVVLIFLVQDKNRATYVKIPGPIMTTSGPEASSGPNNFFGLQAGGECIPGPSENAAYYTVGLNAEGMCGDGAWVTSQLRDYKIDSGIGGSLLEK